MDERQTISVLGLGLMGASLALALRSRGFAGRLVGYARREETRRRAMEEGVVDEAFADPSEAARVADVAVICVPIWAIADLAKRVAPALKAGAVATDVGSTKSVLLEAVAPAFAESAGAFVGSHPIAGSERTGLEAGDPELYAGRLTVVCAPDGAPAAAKEAVARLWRAAGAEVREMSPEAHDALLASTSHLPHMVAAALARAVADDRPERKADFCGTGFKDATRVASGSADMWVDIVDTNRAALERELDRFHEELRGLIGILRSGNGADIRRWLEEAAADRDRMLELNRFLK